MTDEEFRAWEQEIVRKSLVEMDAGQYAGRQIADLEPAFNSVKNRENWKLPVDAIVLADADLDLISTAVAYYTGSEVDFIPLSDGRLRVVASGYYACIGA